MGGGAAKSAGAKLTLGGTNDKVLTAGPHLPELILLRIRLYGIYQKLTKKYNLSLDVRIDNSLPWGTQAQGWDSNPEPTFPQAAGPMDQGPAHPRFFGIKPLQAEAPAKSQSQNTCISLTMVAPKEEPLKLPNGSRDGTSVNFMSLKSSQVTNQTLMPKIKPGFGPDPVITTKNQEN
ncbi:hypothetical protein DSO57_1001602 [Entomophthora muscae]|uniref:Uncharacterized protein n=1 Tax=Entomophthora muscae TaxID=34485 RepID=A0ACC2SB59_9FUNG|nr:hypothetical protein DSO57_1001602 [Entomophthora muscae]